MGTFASEIFQVPYQLNHLMYPKYVTHELGISLELAKLACLCNIFIIPFWAEFIVFVILLLDNRNLESNRSCKNFNSLDLFEHGKCWTTVLI